MALTVLPSNARPRTLHLLVDPDNGDGIRAPDAVDETPSTGPLEGGMGMSIIRAIVDELAVEPGDGGQGTVVRMVKYLTPRP